MKMNGRKNSMLLGKNNQKDRYAKLDKIKIWHPTKNGKLKPADFPGVTWKKVWWICKKGHEWQAKEYKNVKIGCPYCAGKKVCGDNSLAAVNPELAKEWNYKKNAGLTPHDVTSGTEKKVWWKCKRKHEWKASVNKRNRGSGCHYCSSRRVCKDNSLAAINPNLAKEWHSTRNGNLTPGKVTLGSPVKAWWKCKKGHEWQAVINRRNRGNKCPYCSHLYVSSEFSLLTIKPKLAKEWHPTKNGKLKPSGVTSKSGRKVWWMCKKGHEWKTAISSRKEGSKCSICCNRKVSAVTSLLALNPKLAKEWHPTRNGELLPENVVPGTSRKAWWICKHGHEWQAIVVSRNKGHGCPYCSGVKASMENCLAAKNPRLAKEWHPTKNGKLTPEDVLPGSNKKIWWICELGHVWMREVIYRKNRGCPECAYALKEALKSRGGSVGGGVAGELTNKLRRKTKQKSKYFTEKSINYPFEKLPKMKIFDKKSKSAKKC